MQKVGREMRRSLSGGVTLELSVYALQFALWFFGHAPHNVSANVKLNEDDVDDEAHIVMDFGSGHNSEIMVSSTKRLDNRAVIKCSNGSITCPVNIIDVDGEERQLSLPKSDLLTYFPDRLALSFEAEEVRRCILQRKTQSELPNHKESVLLSSIEDQIRRKLGVIYTEDNRVNYC